MRIGTVVQTIPAGMLGNNSGTLGVVYEEYNIGDGPGVSIIFENGEYDGFSPDEQKRFLKEVGFSYECADYQFKNVMTVSQDFESGFFDKPLKEKKYVIGEL